MEDRNATPCQNDSRLARRHAVGRLCIYHDRVEL
jgi:hypothetical protein